MKFSCYFSFFFFSFFHFLAYSNQKYQSLSLSGHILTLSCKCSRTALGGDLICTSIMRVHFASLTESAPVAGQQNPSCHPGRSLSRDLKFGRSSFHNRLRLAQTTFDTAWRALIQHFFVFHQQNAYFQKQYIIKT